MHMGNYNPSNITLSLALKPEQLSSFFTLLLEVKYDCTSTFTIYSFYVYLSFLFKQMVLQVSLSHQED